MFEKRTTGKDSTCGLVMPDIVSSSVSYEQYNNNNYQSVIAIIFLRILCEKQTRDFGTTSV